MAPPRLSTTWRDYDERACPAVPRGQCMYRERRVCRKDAEYAEAFSALSILNSWHHVQRLVADLGRVQAAKSLSRDSRRPKFRRLREEMIMMSSEQ